VKKEPEWRTELEVIIRDGNYKKVSRQMLLEKLENYDLLEEARKMAYTFANRSIKNLEVLSKSEYRSALEEIPNYMIERAK
jgi:geranylgeranyl pyrophosphate synthase